MIHIMQTSDNFYDRAVWQLGSLARRNYLLVQVMWRLFKTYAIKCFRMTDVIFSAILSG